jgi:hypothetical protein
VAVGCPVTAVAVPMGMSIIAQPQLPWRKSRAGSRRAREWLQYLDN